MKSRNQLPTIKSFIEKVKDRPEVYSNEFYEKLCEDFTQTFKKKIEKPNNEELMSEKTFFIYFLIGLWSEGVLKNPVDKFSRKFVRVVDNILIKNGNSFSQEIAIIFITNLILNADSFNVRDKTKKMLFARLYILEGDSTLPKETRDIASANINGLKSKSKIRL